MARFEWSTRGSAQVVRLFILVWLSCLTGCNGSVDAGGVADSAAVGGQDSNRGLIDTNAFDEVGDTMGTTDVGEHDLGAVGDAYFDTTTWDLDSADAGSVPYDITTDSSPDTAADVTSGPLPTCPAGVGAGKVLKDLSYGVAHPRQRLDLYLPKETGLAPVLIWIHGGAWKAGDKSPVPGNVLIFRERGYAVASVRYRLSDHPWPAPVSDVRLAVRWLRDNATTYGLDAKRFAAWGASAGAHLAEMLAVSSDVPALDGPKPSLSTLSSGIQAAVAFFGPSSLQHMDADAATNKCPKGALCHDCAGSPETLLLDCPSTLTSCSTKLLTEASPISHVDASDPPMLLVHGEDDCTVPTLQSVRLHNAVVKTGGAASLILVSGAGHNHGAVSTAKVNATARALLDAELRGCTTADSPQMSVDACHQKYCKTQAETCNALLECPQVDLCFRGCLSAKKSLNQCIATCTKGIPKGGAVWSAHYALFKCANAVGCYD